MIDVVFVHYGDPWLRGSENCLLELVTRLDRARFRPRVVCNQPVLQDAFLARGIDAVQLDIPEIMIDRSEVRLEAGAYVRTSRRILALARAWRPDIFYCNSGRASQATWLAARVLGVPRLCHIHAPFYRRYYWLWGLWDARQLLFASEDTRRRSLAAHRFPRIASVVPNGVDLERFRPPVDRDPAVRRYLGLREDQIVLGQVGSLIPRKGVDVLLRALPALRSGRPWALLLAGAGSERLRLEAMARDLGVAGAVRFLGEVRGPETLLQHAIDVNVLAAREESLPLALIEAAACGVPTVCTDVGGNAEVVRDGESGLVVPAEDPAALGAALVRLVGDSALRAGLGAAARRRAEKRFGIDGFVATIERTLRDWAPGHEDDPSRPPRSEISSPRDQDVPPTESR